MVVHGPAGPLAGQCPLRIFRAEVIHHISIITAVDEAEVHHHRRAAVLSLVLQIHDMLHIRKAQRLAVGDVLRGDVAAPGPDGPIHTGLLHVYPGSKQLGPGGNHQLRHMGLSLQYQVGVSLEGCVLPGLCHPGIDEVLMGFRVVSALEVFFGDIREPHKGRVKGVDPEAHPLSVGAVLFDHPPLPEPQHLPLVLVCDNPAALRAGVHRQLRPVNIRHALIIGELEVCPLELYHLPTMGAGDKVVFLDVTVLQGFPDVPGGDGRGTGDKYLAVLEGLGALPCQGDRVRLFGAGAGVLVHLIQEKKTDSLAGQVRGRVGAHQAQVHPVKLKLQLFALQRLVPLPQGWRGQHHRHDTVFGDALCQHVRWIHYHCGGRVLLDDVAQGIEDRLCAAQLG